MTSTVMSVSPVASRADARGFRELPYRLFRNEPRWVPPLRSTEKERWSPRKNASLAARWTQRFLARKGGRIVGRIAAIEDPGFAERWCPGAGAFGFFDCVPDGDVASALLTAVESALVARGVCQVLGPINLTTHDEVGLLVEGFDQPQTILSSWSPPSYPALVEAAAYAPLRDFHAYHWDPGAVRSEAVERLIRRFRSPGSPLEVRGVRANRWDEEGRILLSLYNASFADLWGFVPMDPAEYAQRASLIQQFYEPELVRFAEWDGSPVGFCLVVPDINQLLAGLGGRLLPFGWIRLLRDRKRLRRARMLLLGVLPAFRARGIAAVLAAEVADVGRRLGIDEGELSLVHEDNQPIQAVIAASGCTRTKTWRLYNRELERP
jgi:GNAT superfamily N-acetyltransferase